jgi:hypothetical protein
MKVAELIAKLVEMPKDADVVMTYDISDHDTLFEIVAVEPRKEVIVIIAS